MHVCTSLAFYFQREINYGTEDEQATNHTSNVWAQKQESSTQDYTRHGIRGGEEKKKKRHKPPLRTAFNWKIPLPCGPDTGNVQDTECLWWVTARDALYQGPFFIGSPMASMTAWFLLAFSMALLRSYDETVNMTVISTFPCKIMNNFFLSTWKKFALQQEESLEKYRIKKPKTNETQHYTSLGWEKQTDNGQFYFPVCCP